MAKGCKNFFSGFPLDPNQTHPWLLVSHGENREFHTFYNISKNEHIERNIPEFSNKQVSSTSYGWLVLIDHSKLPLDCCLVKPSSEERIQLPSIELEPRSTKGWYYQCVLSKLPSDPNCYVLLVSSNNESILFCRLGDKKFIKRTKEIGDDYFRVATNFKGKIYAWMCYSCNFVEVDFASQDLLLNQMVNDRGQPCRIPWPSPLVSAFFDDHLVESDNELLLAHTICYPHSGEVVYFRIFQIKTSEKEAEELRSIGDRTIFLCRFGSISSMCIDKKSSSAYLKKNSIYYIWPDKNLYCYDIEDRSKTLVKPCLVKSNATPLRSWLML